MSSGDSARACFGSVADTQVWNAGNDMLVCQGCRTLRASGQKFVCVFVRVGDVDDGLVQKEGASRCASAAAGGGGDAFCRGV